MSERIDAMTLEQKGPPLKEIYLLVHPGYGKTATTWFQTYVLPRLPSVLNLGKGGGGKGEDFIGTDLRKAQYELFNPIYRDEDFRSRYRNSRRLIDSYVDILCLYLNKYLGVLNGTPELACRDVACISDENILGYGGAEINSLLLRLVLLELKRRFNGIANINISICMTIREQSSFLQSFYAYDYHHQKSRFANFNEFIKYGLSSVDSGIFGQLDYCSSYLLLNDVLSNVVSDISFIPYEIIRNDPCAYVKRIFNEVPLSDESLSSIDGLSFGNSVNANRDFEGRHFIRDYGLLMNALIFLSHNYVVQSRKSVFLRRISPALKKPYEYIQTKFGRIKKGQVLDVDHLLLDRLSSSYAVSNRRLQELLGIDLESLGYKTE